MSEAFRQGVIAGTWRLSGLLYRSALLAGAALLLGSLALLTAGDAFSKIRADSPRTFQDFVKYYACGKIALSPSRHLAYDRHYQLAVLNEYLQMPEPETIPVNYPPVVFAIMASLALMPPERAFAVWFDVSLIVGLAGLYLVRRRSWLETGLIAVGALATAAAWRTFALGQIGWLLVGMLGLFYWAWRRQRHCLAGIALVLAGLKLQYAPFFLVPVVMGRRWKTLGSAAVTVGVLVCVSGAVLGWQALASYPSFLLYVEHVDAYRRSMMCLTVLADTLISPRLVPAVSAASVAVGVLGSVWIWRRALNLGEAAEDWAMALTICTALIFSSHAHSYDSIILALAATLTLPTLVMSKAVAIDPPSFRMWCVLLMLYPVAGWIINIWFAEGTRYASLGQLFVCSLLLACGVRCYMAMFKTGSGA
jgi:hypothetical protein